MTVLNNPFHISTDESKIESFKRLQSGQTYRQILSDEHGDIRIGNLSIKAEDLGDALDVPFEAPKSVEMIVKTQERLSKLLDLNQRRVDALNKSLETKARRILSGSPVTKSELALAELREKVSQLNVFNNPLNVATEVVKLRNEKGTVYQVRLAGSAVTQLLPGEDEERARNRLRELKLDDTTLLIGLMGLKPTEANKAAVRHATFPYRQPLPENQVGIVVAYAIAFSDLTKLRRCVEKLLNVPRLVHVLDASRTDSATLRMNLSPEEEMAELETEETGETELNLSDAI